MQIQASTISAPVEAWIVAGANGRVWVERLFDSQLRDDSVWYSKAWPYMDTAGYGVLLPKVTMTGWPLYITTGSALVRPL